MGLGTMPKGVENCGGRSLEFFQPMEEALISSSRWKKSGLLSVGG